MAWWNDIRDMLKQEIGPAALPAAEMPAAPKPLRQAQLLLQRTARELVEARLHADVVSRRLARAQQRLEALTQAPQPHPRYRERLVELARAIARDSDLAGSFRTHLSQLDRLHDEVNRQLRELDHDLSMARAASAISQTTQVAAGRGPARKPSASPRGKSATPPRNGKTAAQPRKNKTDAAAAADAAAPGFRRARAGRVIDTLQKLPRRRRQEGHED